MDKRERLIPAFDAAMYGVYQHAKDIAGYNATRYLQMLQQYGGLETAHRLLADDDVGYGFAELWISGHAKLTVEYVVLSGDFSTLFEADELRRARERLGRYAPK